MHRLKIPFREPLKPCYHGGAFFDSIGERFDRLERRHTVINADVLDAWFDPSPRVLDALREHLPWLLRTSPPTTSRGMVQTIAELREVPESCVLPGAGSSDLIYLALGEWLSPGCRVLILDPTYGEYAHVLERVLRCRVERFPLRRQDDYDIDIRRFESVATKGYDLVVLVNPNSPTGRYVPRLELKAILPLLPVETTVWIDETYLEYVDPNASLERFAASSANVIVCKSLSKVYALSGARAAYLVGPMKRIASLRQLSPPWAVSLCAQVAAVNALRDPAYYEVCWRETRLLRKRLSTQLRRRFSVDVVEGKANFLFCHLPETGPDAATVVHRCIAEGLYLRDASDMGQQLGAHALRIAVKDEATNQRMLQILTRALRDP